MGPSIEGPTMVKSPGSTATVTRAAEAVETLTASPCQTDEWRKEPEVREAGCTGVIAVRRLAYVIKCGRGTHKARYRHRSAHRQVGGHR
jgi:hypothetical protein